MKYNIYERAIAKYLSNFPRAKSFIKHTYSRVSYFLHRKGYKYKAIHPIKELAPGYDETFFGYYDHSPESSAGRLILNIPGKKTSAFPDSNSSLTIAVLEAEANEPSLLINSLSYNWQQGARAHWLNNDLLIYNDYDLSSGKYMSRVYSFASGEEVKKFSYPVQDSFGKDYFLSINYQRIESLRPDYGYKNIAPMSLDSLSRLDNDGIWRVDYSSGSARLVVSLANVFSFQKEENFDIALHKVNHLMISPDGSKFIFLHRYIIAGKRFDRLMLADSYTGQLRLLNNYGMISHCFWVDNVTIFGYMRGPGRKDAYWLLDLHSGTFKSFANGALDQYGDGHPHVCGEWLVTDTYPDKSRMQHLILANLKTGEVRELGEFFHGFDFSGESRCDLHPRFSPSGDRVFFDSVFSGQRHLYSIKAFE